MNQINLSYASAEKMKQDAKYIRSLFLAGRQVCILQNGYGKLRYAMLNVQRWDIKAKANYTCAYEYNGLPASWVKVLSKILFS